MVSKNAMLRQIVSSTEIYLIFYEIYQQDLPKVIVLKRSTQVVMSSALYIAYYQQKVSKNALLW